MSGSPPSRLSRPEAIRTKPAIIRSREDFPAPFRPVTTIASPVCTPKLRFRKTSRPPRLQDRFSALSCITAAVAHSPRTRELHGRRKTPILRAFLARFPDQCSLLQEKPL